MSAEHLLRTRNEELLHHIKQLENDLVDARKDQAWYKWIVRDFDRAEMKLEDYLYTDFETLDDFIDAAIKEQK